MAMADDIESNNNNGDNREEKKSPATVMGVSGEKTTFLSIDDMLGEVGEYGRFQKMINIMFCIITFPAAYQLLISYFAFDPPTWRCKPNTRCQSMLADTRSMFTDNHGIFTDNHRAFTSNRQMINENYTRAEFPNTDTRNCQFNRSEWEFTRSLDYSIVTTFDLQCDTQFLISLTTSTLFIGWLFGAITLGWCIDTYGRVKPLFISVAAVIILGLISPLMPNIYSFMAVRFFIGFFFPGTFPQIMFTYISEVVGGRYRAFAGLSIFLFVGTALAFLALKAYLIQQWKILYYVCTGPYLFVVLFYKYVPESMRFLRVKGRLDEAMEVFRGIAKQNGTEIRPGVSIEPPPEILIHRRANPLELFRTGQMAIKSIIQGFAYFIGAMTFFALYLGAADISGHLYRDYTIVTLIEIPVCLCMMDFAERFGRKRTVMTSLLIGSIASVGLGFTPRTTFTLRVIRVIVAMIGKVSISAFCNSFQTWTCELYPTTMRGSGVGMTQVMSRLGAAAAPWVNMEFNKYHHGASYVFVGVGSLITYFLLCLLPEMKGVPAVDAMEEGDREVENIAQMEMEEDVVGCTQAYENPFVEED